MGMARPTGAYVEQMLEPGGWPEADEDVFYGRAEDFTRVLHQVADVLNTCLRQRVEVFEGGVWAGGAATAADGGGGGRIDQLLILQDDLAGVITWHDYVANSIVQAKSLIGDNVEIAYRQIDILHNDPTLEADERNTAINVVLSTTYGANVGLVTT